jgi:glc operon protein GlcG
MNKSRSGSQPARAWRGVAIALLAIATVWCTTKSPGQEPVRSATKAADLELLSDVMDKAGLFSAGAIEAARQDLRRIERETHVATLIHTVESLRGQKLAAAATEAARHSGIEGAFILIAKKEKEIELLVSKKFSRVLTPKRQSLIRAAFIDGFKKQDFDEGLKRGVAAVAQELAAAGHERMPAHNDSASTALGFTSAATAPAGAVGPLVVRNQVRLGLAGARAMIAAAEAKALEMKLKLDIAVVDDGGHLLAFERMDGARPASVYTAITKATSAATFRQASGPLAAGASAADPLLNISLQNAAQASGGKITALYGGVPVIVDGQTIGAVGIAGGTGEQDAEVARAGVQALTNQLTATESATKDARPVEKPE